MPATQHEPQSLQTTVVIREFQPGDEAAFRQLNEEWITRFFRLEEKDVQMLADPRKYILDKGGRILFAVAGEERVGCCALIRMSDDEYEVAKMGVTFAWQGAGIGRKLLRAAIDLGRAIHARRLYLESSSKLTPAIHLYESLGFRHLPQERIPVSPYARADIFMEMLLR